MTGQEFDEKAIFNIARTIESAEARAEYLRQASGGDAELIERIQTLLSAYEEKASFLESPAVDLMPTSNGSPIDERPGTVIGPYKLLQPIGEGGMGIVFMAEQNEPIQRVVALKIIKPGMDSQQVIARFETERQALAMMDHPNIAKVLDAGTTASGRPYFAMELVKGVSITKYCDEKQLSLRDRLELLLPVCQAVQHAHQKGIIHRDLKPSNVLVAAYENHAVPKVIDFGVAKATVERLTERTMFTEFGQLIGTVEYMSPEQAELNQLDIDTRSDIYSLGVLLYELLTGSTPFEQTRLRKEAFDEVLRIIREEEPPKPSTKLSTSATLPSIAANRHSEPAKLSRAVRGDLDWIVMKSLEKDRNRRYESANGLAAEIERYLSDEPVHAGPPSVWYRSTKFARRNRLAIVTATLIATAMALGTMISVWQAILAETARSAEAEQRAIAEAERNDAKKQRALAEANLRRARQAVDEYFTLVSESKLLDVPGMQPLRKELLEAAFRYYQAMSDERNDDPVVLADLAVTQLRMAKVYHELDRNDQALSAIQSGVQLAERLRREYPDDIEHHLRLAGYWNVHRGTGSYTKMPKDPPAAHRTLSRFLQLWDVFARENPSVEAFQNDLASINILLAVLEGGRGRGGESAAFARATVYSRKAIAIWEQLSQSHPEVAAHRDNLAKAYGELAYELNHAGKSDESREASQRSRALREQLVAEFPDVPEYRAQAASRLTGQASSLAGRRPQEAEAAYRRALQAWQELVTDFPTAPQYTIELVRAQFKFASLLAGPLKRRDDAIAESQQGIERLRKRIAEYPAEPIYREQLPFALRELAEGIRGFKGQLGDAEKLHRQALAEWNNLAREFPQEPQYVEQAGHSYRYLGWIVRDAGRPDEALDHFDRGIASFQQLADAGSPGNHGYYTDYLADTLLQKVDILLGAGRGDDAEQTIGRAVDLYATLVQDYPEMADYRSKASAASGKSGDYYLRKNDFTKAVADYSEAIKHTPSEAHYWHERAYCNFMLREHSKSVADHSRAIELNDNDAGPRLRRGQSHRALGQPQQAEQDFSRAIELNPAAAENWYARAYLYSEQNQVEKAAADLAKAVEHWPTNPDDQNQLAWWLTTQFDPPLQSPLAAVDLAERAVAGRPGSGTFWHTLGVAHYRTGDWKAAVDALTKSTELRNGGDSFDWFVLAMAQWQSGNKDEARKWYGKAVEWMAKSAAVNHELVRFRAEAAELLNISKTSE